MMLQIIRPSLLLPVLFINSVHNFQFTIKSSRGKRSVHQSVNDFYDPCHIYSTRYPINQDGSVTNRVVNQTEWLQAVNDCFQAKQQTVGFAKPINIEFIYPGTKWCGAGNVADHYWDLGPHTQTDKCCREHDHCFDIMPPNTCKYSLCNYSPFTRSHCVCDEQFRRCLMNSNEPASTSVGLMFFDVGAIGCFRQSSSTTGHCLTYVGTKETREQDDSGSRQNVQSQRRKRHEWRSSTSSRSGRWCFVAPLPFKKSLDMSTLEDPVLAESRSLDMVDPIFKRVLTTLARQVTSIAKDVASSSWKHPSLTP